MIIHVLIRAQMYMNVYFIIVFNSFTEFDGLVSRIANNTKKNLDGLRLDTTSWKEQFNEAMTVNGGDVENATVIDYILHFISFFWKVKFSEN